MKKHLPLQLFLILAIALLWVASCKKDEVRNPQDWTPDQFQVKELGITQAAISWNYDGIGDLEGFKIDRKVDQENWQIGFATLPADSRSWTDTDIVPVPEHTYQYRIYAFNGSQISNSVSISYSSVFYQPSNATVFFTNPLKTALITWEDNSEGELGFKIDKNINGEILHEAYAVLPPNTEEYTDTNIFKTTNVNYSVYAYTESYESKKSQATISTTIPAPTNLFCERLSIMENKLSWSFNENLTIDHFLIKRIDNGATINLGTTRELEFIDSIFTINSLYNYYVIAVIENTESDFCSVVANTNFVAPTNPAISRTAMTKVEISWEYSTPGFEGFIIERSYNANIWIHVATVSETNCTDEDFQINETVKYRISAYLDEYVSDPTYSSPFVSDVPAPENLQIERKDITNVKLEWTALNFGEDGYKVYRSYDGLNFEQIATTQGNFWFDDNFELKQTVNYRVHTLFEDQLSIFAPASFYSSIPPPENLQIERIEITNVKLKWTALNFGEDGYMIYRSYDGLNFEQIATTQGNYWFDDNFELEQTVNYRVHTLIEDQLSIFAPASFYSNIPPPENLTLTRISNTSIQMDWVAGLAGDEGFKIEKAIAGSNWEELSETPPGITTYIDNDANYYDCSSNVLQYRVSTKYSDNYSQPISQQTSGSAMIDERDGRIYNTVKIGDELCWFAENLKWMPAVNPPNEGSQSEAHYYVPEYNGNNVTEAQAFWSYNTYGVLYNLPATAYACPDGWRIPSNDDWDNLIEYFGSYSITGGKLKEAGTAHWASPNVGATNEVGFTALPAGERNTSGFIYIYNRARFWSSDTTYLGNGSVYFLKNNLQAILESTSVKENGQSIRCIKNINK